MALFLSSIKTNKRNAIYNTSEWNAKVIHYKYRQHKSFCKISTRLWSMWKIWTFLAKFGNMTCSFYTGSLPHTEIYCFLFSNLIPFPTYISLNPNFCHVVSSCSRCISHSTIYSLSSPNTGWELFVIHVLDTFMPIHTLFL